MSIDTSDEINSESRSPMSPEHLSPDTEWESFCRQLDMSAKSSSVERVFGSAAKRGGVYRWGIAATRNAASHLHGGNDPCDDFNPILSRLSCGSGKAVRSAKGKANAFDFSAATDSLIARVSSTRVSSEDASTAVVWGAALPALSRHIDQAQWWLLLRLLQQLHASTLQARRESSPIHLLLGGELGLTLAWRLGPHLADCQRLQSSSIEAFTSWCAQDDESISSAIAGYTDTRLILASLIRCMRIIKKTTKNKVSKQALLVGNALATWVAAMTTHTGATAFSEATRKELRDDLPPDGLLGHAVEFDRDALQPAINAALGATQTGGRLVWQVDLPETIHHDPIAKIATIFADWDVRRGRTHLDYSREEVAIEIFGGRSEVIAGPWQTLIQVDDEEQQPCGDWDDVCQYTDDDVHYLEIEQAWTGGIRLQRQIMLLRDDRCLLLADAVLCSQQYGEPGADGRTRSIKYTSRLPLCRSIEVESEPETREVFLGDSRRRGLVIPLSASEWRSVPTTATCSETDDHHLLFAAEGRGQLYAPLWFDFQQRRFKRMRTWRQLTVADQLKIVGRDEATGFRVQIGSEQWAIYRSLVGQSCRSVLGKHLIADFFCSRFDSGDGSHDELLTVDESDADDD